MSFFVSLNFYVYLLRTCVPYRFLFSTNNLCNLSPITFVSSILLFKLTIFSFFSIVRAESLSLGSSVVSLLELVYTSMRSLLPLPLLLESGKFASNIVGAFSSKVNPFSSLSLALGEKMDIGTSYTWGLIREAFLTSGEMSMFKGRA